MRVLVLSTSNHRGAFAAIRRLHVAGWDVSVGTSAPDGLVSWTRRKRAVFTVPPPERGYELFLEAVGEAVEASRAEVVIPSDDADLIALSLGRDQIPAIVPYAPHDVVARLLDKLELTKAAISVDLPAIATAIADDVGIRQTSFPAVVKPRFHWRPGDPLGAPPRIAATICADHVAAAAAADSIRERGTEPLVQEFVRGQLVSVQLVADGAGVVSLTQQESPPMFFPPGAGVRVRSTVVATDPKLAAGIGRLIESTGWFGFAGLQFLRDESGIPRLIDFNGRITASLEAVAGAGPNYAAAWTAMATGRRARPIGPARLGKRCQWLEGDLRRALKERRGGLVRDVAGCLRYSVGATHTVLKLDEPYAVVRHTVAQLREAQRHRRGGRHWHARR